MLDSVEQTILLPAWISSHGRELAKRILPEGMKSGDAFGSITSLWAHASSKSKLSWSPHGPRRGRSPAMGYLLIAFHQNNLSEYKSIKLSHSSHKPCYQVRCDGVISLFYTLPRTDRTTFPSQVHLREARISATPNYHPQDCLRAL